MAKASTKQSLHPNQVLKRSIKKSSKSYPNNMKRSMKSSADEVSWKIKIPQENNQQKIKNKNKTQKFCSGNVTSGIKLTHISTKSSSGLSKSSHLININSSSKSSKMDLTTPQTLENLFINSGSKMIKSSIVEWDNFWNSKPTVIGIDTEGIHHIPPLLIQIAYRDINQNIKVILEAPTNGKLSKNMKKLLNDLKIQKVFCDASGDKESLGVNIIPNLYDIQEMASNLFNAPLKLGLGKLGSEYVFNNNPIIKNKKGWRYFAFHKFRPSNISWPSIQQQNKLCVYAAADAWITLEIFESMQTKIIQMNELKSIKIFHDEKMINEKNNLSIPSSSSSTTSISSSDISSQRKRIGNTRLYDQFVEQEEEKDDEYVVPKFKRLKEDQLAPSPITNKSLNQNIKKKKKFQTFVMKRG